LVQVEPEDWDRLRPLMETFATAVQAAR
jgi:hypothetical protein